MAVDPGVPDDQAVSPVGDQQATDAGESRASEQPVPAQEEGEEEQHLEHGIDNPHQQQLVSDGNQQNGKDADPQLETSAGGTADDHQGPRQGAGEGEGQAAIDEDPGEIDTDFIPVPGVEDGNGEAAAYDGDIPAAATEEFDQPQGDTHAAGHQDDEQHDQHYTHSEGSLSEQKEDPEQRQEGDHDHDTAAADAWDQQGGDGSARTTPEPQLFSESEPAGGDPGSALPSVSPSLQPDHMEIDGGNNHSQGPSPSPDQQRGADQGQQEQPGSTTPRSDLEQQGGGDAEDAQLKAAADGSHDQEEAVPSAAGTPAADSKGSNAKHVPITFTLDPEEMKQREQARREEARKEKEAAAAAAAAAAASKDKERGSKEGDREKRPSIDGSKARDQSSSKDKDGRSAKDGSNRDNKGSGTEGRDKRSSGEKGDEKAAPRASSRERDSRRQQDPPSKRDQGSSRGGTAPSSAAGSKGSTRAAPPTSSSRPPSSAPARGNTSRDDPRSTRPGSGSQPAGRGRSPPPLSHRSGPAAGHSSRPNGPHPSSTYSSRDAGRLPHHHSSRDGPAADVRSSRGAYGDGRPHSSTAPSAGHRTGDNRDIKSPGHSDSRGLPASRPPAYDRHSPHIERARREQEQRDREHKDRMERERLDQVERERIKQEVLAQERARIEQEVREKEREQIERQVLQKLFGGDSDRHGHGPPPHLLRRLPPQRDPGYRDSRGPDVRGPPPAGYGREADRLGPPLPMGYGREDSFGPSRVREPSPPPHLRGPPGFPASRYIPPPGHDLPSHHRHGFDDDRPPGFDRRPPADLPPRGPAYPDYDSRSDFGHSRQLSPPRGRGPSPMPFDLGRPPSPHNTRPYPHGRTHPHDEHLPPPRHSSPPRGGAGPRGQPPSNFHSSRSDHRSERSEPAPGFRGGPPPVGPTHTRQPYPEDRIRLPPPSSHPAGYDRERDRYPPPGPGPRSGPPGRGDDSRVRPSGIVPPPYSSTGRGPAGPEGRGPPPTEGGQGHDRGGPHPRDQPPSYSRDEPGYRAGYPPHPDARNVERARAGPPPSSTTHGAPPRRRSRSRSPPHPSSSARAPPAPDYTSDYMRPKTGESTAAAAGRQLDSRDARPDHRQGPGDGGYGHGSAPAGGGAPGSGAGRDTRRRDPPPQPAGAHAKRPRTDAPPNNAAGGYGGSQPQPSHQQGSVRPVTGFSSQQGTTGTGFASQAQAVTAGFAAAGQAASAPAVVPLAGRAAGPVTPAVASAVGLPYALPHVEDKAWLYLDPDGMQQGPCSVAQFRTWLATLAGNPALGEQLAQFREAATWHITATPDQRRPLYALMELYNRVA